MGDPSPREQIRAAVLCAVGAALLLAGPLFGGRSTMGFDVRDPRLDLRPWVDAGHDVTSPLNPILPDPDLYLLPGLVRMRQLAEQGAGPWWDGSQLLGYPLGANLPFPVFHPAAWLTTPFDPVTAFDLLLWFHTAVAAFLAWRAVRLMGCEQAAAAFAAVAFSLSAWMTLHWGAPTMTYAAVWWPGLVAAAEWIRRGEGRRGLVEGSAFGALSLVSGFPQIGVYVVGGFVLLVTLELGPGWRRRSATALVAALLAVGLAWPQLAVSGAAYRESLRSTDETRAATAGRGLEPVALFGLLFPDFFGRPMEFAGPDPPAPTMEQWLPHRRWVSQRLQSNMVEQVSYPGMAVLLLLPLALSVGRRARRLLLLSVLALAGAMLWPLLVSAFPPLSAAGAGSIKRVVVLAAGSLPLAAALGLEARRRGRSRPPWGTAALLAVMLLVVPLWAAGLDDPQAGDFSADLTGQALRQGLFLALALVGLALAAAGGVGPWLVSAVVLADLAAFALGFHPFPEQRPEVFPTTASLQRLQEREGRVAVLGEMNLLLPMPAGLHGLRSVHGAAAMVPRRSAELLECVERPLLDREEPRLCRPFSSPASLDHPVLDLLGVDTVVFGDPAYIPELPGPVLWLDEQEGLGAMGRPSAGPRAFLSRGVRRVDDPEQRLALLSDPAFPVHETVLVETETGLDLPERSSWVPLPVTSPADDRFFIAIDEPRAGIVVLTEAWDPGWSVRTDGRPAELLLAQHALMGVAVTPDVRSVEFRYRAPGLAASVWITRLVLAAWFLLLLVRGRRKGSTGAFRAAPWAD